MGGVSPIGEVLAFYEGPGSNTEQAVRLLLGDLMDWADELDPSSPEYLALVDAVAEAAERTVKRLAKTKQHEPRRRAPLRLL